ncbi:hypothetical protein CIW49_26940 [Mycolicibacterium sp. P1-18]|uniref:conjugal transfer protein n=1 Tax=Mycolicibacterium sp. P1-18 TaxID=2024615 RepID=UPI0011F2AD6D|nr:conjugal transfer protein [Mycolicibacterium sp. P1-18]KAA0093680.1 hypothetical protein CIW49_26940 [Mycolicibacterium sp. P1-18]
MAMSKTWAGRLRRARRHGSRAATVVLVALALLGGAAAVKVFLVPDRPDVEAIASQVDDRRDQVGAFAADFVVAWLTATTACHQDPGPADGTCRDADRDVLRRYLTVPDDTPLTLPVTPAAVVTSPQVVSVVDAGSVADAQLYAVVVAVDERPYPSAAATRAYYRVPTSLWHYQTRAVALPTRVNGPGPGVDLGLNYRQALSSASPVYAVVRGFVNTYLTATTGLDRYVIAGTALTPVGGYRSAVVSSAATTDPIPDHPAPGAEIQVLATVLAQTTQFATVTMTYPLTVTNSGGTWMVAAIDSMPRTGDPTGRTGG